MVSSPSHLVREYRQFTTNAIKDRHLFLFSLDRASKFLESFMRQNSQQQHLSFMEKHFNNSLLQLTFPVNQDFMSESIIPKLSRPVQNQLHLSVMEPNGLHTRRQMPTFQGEVLLGTKHPMELEKLSFCLQGGPRLSKGKAECFPYMRGSDF